MARRDFGLHKVGKVWHCEFRVGKTYIHRSTKRQDYNQAMEIAKTWHNEALDQEQGVKISRDITVKDLFSRWKAWASVHYSEGHVEAVSADWDRHILPMIGTRKAKTISDSDAESLRTKYLSEPSQRNAHTGKPSKQARSVAGANKISKYLRLVFRWGVKPAGLLARVPFSVRMERPKEPQRTFLHKEQIHDFLNAVDRTSLHVKVAVRMQLMLGLRENEALSLRWDAFSHDLSEVNPPGKMGNAPPLPVPPELREWLLKLPRDRTGLVLPAADGSQHRPHFTTKAIKRGSVAVGLAEKLSPHRMRGSFATMAAREQAGAHTIKKALRHDCLQTSERYVNLDTKDIAAVQSQIFGYHPETQKSRKRSANKVVNLALRWRKKNKS